MNGWIFNNDFLIKMCFIVPAVYSVLCSVDFFFFMVHQVLFCIMYIQVIYNKYPIPFQTCADCSHSIIMFSSGLEITKAGKKIKSIIKIINPERQAHVMLVKFKIFLFISPGINNTRRGNINTGNKKSFLSKNPAVASTTTGDIQDKAFRPGLEMIYQVVYKSLSFIFISFKI